MGHLEPSCELPNTHEKCVTRDFLAAIFVVYFASVDKVLEASKSADGGIRKPYNILDFVHLGILGEFLTIIWRLGAQKILLDTKWNFIRADQDNYKNWMGLTILSQLGI
jgi:hypothetical protein